MDLCKVWKKAGVKAQEDCIPYYIYVQKDGGKGEQ